MTRVQRRAHRLLWIALTLAMALGLALALLLRAPAHAASPTATEGTAR